MADFAYTLAMDKIARGEIDLSSDDIRAILVMTNSTANSQDSAEFISSFTTFDEYDGSGYARQALASLTLTPNLTTKRVHFSSDSIVFASLGAGTRSGFALLIYKHVGADSANIPIFFKQPSGFPFIGNGQNLTLAPHANGWAYLRNGTP